jgi:hypothetical protein
MEAEKDKQVREFRRRKTRQVYAIFLTVFLLISLVWKVGHPGFFLGELSRPTVSLLEVIVIAGFLLFSAANWRCPVCGRYLGPDINSRGCRKCGTKLQ